jgi:hypothetical protein
MKRFQRCVLHIGTEKTGTSSVQKFLALNRDALAADGCYYAAATGRNGEGQYSFVAATRDYPFSHDVGTVFNMNTEEDRVQFAEKFRSALTAEFDRIPDASTWLISSEHFHSRLFHRHEIARLRDFLEPHVSEFEVVLYLRRQDRMAVSLYSTLVKAGQTNPKVFPTIKGEKLPYYFDYEKIHAHWASVFGTDSVRIRLFDPAEMIGGGLIEDFCDVAGLSLEGKARPPIVNESLSQAGVDFLLAVNRQLPEFVDGKPNQLRKMLSRRVSNICRGKCEPVMRPQAEAFYSVFRDSNERLKALKFPERVAPLFNEDFSDYPDTVSEHVPNHGAAVGIAIAIARAMSVELEKRNQD